MTQNQIVIRQLTRGRTLTHGSAFRTFGIARLAARVKELRNEGWPIVTTILELQRKRIAQYSMGRR